MYSCIFLSLFERGLLTGQHCSRQRGFAVSVSACANTQPRNLWKEGTAALDEVMERPSLPAVIINEVAVQENSSRVSSPVVPTNFNSQRVYVAALGPATVQVRDESSCGWWSNSSSLVLSEPKKLNRSLAKYRPRFIIRILNAASLFGPTSARSTALPYLWRRCEGVAPCVGVVPARNCVRGRSTQPARGCPRVLLATPHL